jgi:hypothetical protein
MPKVKRRANEVADSVSGPAGSRRMRGASAVIVGAGVCAVVFASAFLTMADRPLPIDRLQVAEGWADERRCVDCHQQGATFWETGHAQTLQRAEHGSSAELLATLADAPAVRGSGTVVTRTDASLVARNLHDGFESRATLDWCFGSGRHARTWVSTLSDSQGATDLLEYRWSWYRATQGFDITPGQPNEPVPGYFCQLGVLFDPPKSRRCFGCHVSHLPLDAGQLQEAELKPGVTCQRCHGPRAEHVVSGGERGGDGFWSRASQQESVERCAECHRSADEQPPDTITPDNPDIVRFQPIGLTRSACYQHSAMTCVTCHDPHRPLEAQDSTGDWQCVQCHAGHRDDQVPCRAGHSADCLRCHMPKVRMERPLWFTDHWIRTRGEESPP